MKSLKEIRRRIASVKGTQKITRAMKMVAAAKLRRAQETAQGFRAYADLTRDVLSEVAVGATGEEHPLLERREEKRAMVLVITSDRGLCGGFNGNLNRAVLERVEEDGEPTDLAIVGRKAHDYFARRPVEVAEVFSGIYDDPGYGSAARIAQRLASFYEAGRADRIDLAYNEFVSMMIQRPTVRQLLPVSLPERQEVDEAAVGPVGHIFEPGRAELLGRLLPRYVEVEVYRALLESIAAEHAARMTAMDNATNNAADMIDHLTLVYNRARQYAITSDLMDIVGGAEALRE